MPYNRVLEKLRKAVVEGEPDRAQELTGEAVANGIPLLEILENALVNGIREVGEKFGRGEIFLTDLILSGEAMKAGAEILRPMMKEGSMPHPSIGKILIGTVRGDIHSIGKDIVATLMEADGFEVVNIGEDVEDETFVAKTREHRPDLVALSSLLTLTMSAQRDVINLLDKTGLRDEVKVIIGGAPTTQEWADEIGADAWAGDGVAATKQAKKLLGKA